MTNPAHGTLTRYKNGPGEHGEPGIPCRCPDCREANRTWQRNRYRLISYGQWTGRDWVPAAGTQRRLQALAWNGWSWGLLAARLGCTRQTLRVRVHRPGQVKTATATAVAALYDDLWDQPPPERTPHERHHADLARQHARKQGWAPPLAWDDDTIDDPAATPAPGWEPRDGARRYGVLAENAAWLLHAGESAEHVAARLGVSMSTLDTTLARAARRREAGDCRAA